MNNQKVLLSQLMRVDQLIKQQKQVIAEAEETDNPVLAEAKSSLEEMVNTKLGLMQLLGLKPPTR